jgi:hypothetical protein
MAFPMIDSDPTAAGHVPHDGRITRATGVAEARAHLRLTTEQAGVVYSQGAPAGIVTAAALDRAVTEGRGDGPVASVMDYVAVRVDRRTDAAGTLRAFTQAAWAWLRHT